MVGMDYSLIPTTSKPLVKAMDRPIPKRANPLLYLHTLTRNSDEANFINFCTGKTLTNGQQEDGGSCNGVVMGEIPSRNNMISTIITSPAPGEDLAENTDFSVNLQVQNLVAGTFTNPDNTYYSAPQQLVGGRVQGHTHVTIQTLGGDIAAQQPPDPDSFVFFKGVNDAGNGNGGLSADVAGGLPAGVYRVCTMTSSSNHQPVLMPLGIKIKKLTVCRLLNGVLKMTAPSLPLARVRTAVRTARTTRMVKTAKVKMVKAKTVKAKTAKVKMVKVKTVKAKTVKAKMVKVKMVKVKTAR
ncbi:hypothetical protein AJ80_10100, partial [Polytolypa hystricis UAMH7299]